MERWVGKGFEVEFDRGANVAAYSKITGDADRCPCTGCKNFAAQRSTVYPDEFVQLLRELGIDPMKEGYAWECGPDKDGLYIYGGWFHFIGRFLRRGFAVQLGAFEYWFSEGQVPRAPAAFGEGCRCAVEFTTRLKWVIDEPGSG